MGANFFTRIALLMRHLAAEGYSLPLLALVTRIGFIGVASLYNIIAITHESKDAFRFPGKIFNTDYIGDSLVEKVLGPLVQWDAQHFIHIANHGYTYENNLAFFPLYPALIFLCSSVHYFISGLITRPALSVLMATCINIYAFADASKQLLYLSMKVFMDSHFSYRAAIVINLSPATIFFIAPYTESLYMMFFFRALNSLLEDKPLRCLLNFFLASLTRSNGILNAGFIWYSSLLTIITTRKRNLRIYARKSAFLIAGTLATIGPYLIYQYFCWVIFCSSMKPVFPLGEEILNHAKIYNLVLPTNTTSWCYEGELLPYSVIQDKYWDVGLLKYYRAKDIPNFMLASPCVLLVFLFAFEFYKSHGWREFLPFRSSDGYFYFKKPATILQFVLHAVALTTFGILYINVQVITRIIASGSPLMYWIAADAIRPGRKKGKNEKKSAVETSLKGKLILSFFTGYTLFGLLAFSSGFPWT